MKSIYVVLIAALTLISCGKDDGSRVPDVYVRYNITKIEFDKRKDANDVLLVNGQGVAGLMIVKIAPDYYKAFDRCSTVEPEKKCAVNPESTFTATDPCSGAKFLLQDGSPAKAPATRALKQYNVAVTQFEIMVTNMYGN